MLTISGPALMVMVIIAAVCGGVGSALVRGARIGSLSSIALGFFGALLGAWMARQLRLPEPLLLTLDGRLFPVVWSVIGSAVLVAVLHLFTRRRTILRL